MSATTVKTRSHSWKEEILITEQGQKPPPVVAYEFNGGKRRFHDPADQKGVYCQPEPEVTP